ncbi:FMN-linked oxidoreductase [Meredithblackwellia eburnea MCA 4105]
MGRTAATIPPQESAVNVRSPYAKHEYFPNTSPPAGTLLSKEDWPQNSNAPLLFQPITVGKTAKMEFKNRIFVAPMCEYSAEPGTGLPGTWHLVHLGAMAVRGAALVMTEAAGVLPNGRISPEDLGIWSDKHTEAFKPIVQFIQSQGAKAGIQLAHAGRKASTLAPWLDASTMSKNVSTAIAAEGEGNGWSDVWAPSAIPFKEEKYPDPIAMTEKDIEDLKAAWKRAVERADEAGFDVVELHFAHGYLAHEFLSPLSNKRTDKYGGSLENRMRLALEIAEIARATLPAHKPLFVRISATDWHAAGEKDATSGEYISWGVEQSKVFLQELIARGIDLMDVSSGGNDVEQKIAVGPGYQVPFAEQLRASLKPESRIPISSVGLITNGTQAEEILQKGQADVITVAREFLRNADLVFDWAVELNAVVNVPVQYQRAWTRMMRK